MANDAALVTVLRGRVDEFQRDMARAGDIADRQVQDINQKFAQLNPTIDLSAMRQQAEEGGRSTGALLAAGLVAGLAAGAVALGTSLKSTIDRLSELGDKADTLRLPVNLMQALSVQADLARVKQSDLNSALDHFTGVSKKAESEAEGFYKILNDVSAGSGRAFQNATTQSERLRILADAFSRTTDEVKLAKLGSEALGTENERLIGIFQQGREGINNYIADIRRMGLAINENAVVAAQEAKTQLNLVSRVISDEFATAIADLIPLLTRLSPGLELLKKVAEAIAAVSQSVTNADSVKTLTTELGTLETELARVQEEKEKLAGAPQTSLQQTTNSLRSFLRSQLGIDDESLADLQNRERELQERIGAIKLLIQDAGERRNTGRPERPAFKQRGGGADEDEESTGAFDRAQASAKRRIALVEADTAAVGLNEVARGRLRTEAELFNSLEAHGIAVTHEHLDIIEDLGRKYEEAAQKLQAARNQFQGLNDVLRFSGNELVNVLDRATQKGAQFGEIMQDVLRSVTRQLLQAAITGEGAFAKILGLSSPTAGSPGGGGVGGLLGALSGLFKTGSNVSGTDNWRGGLTWVGERGPELLNLPRGSQIIPNDVVRSGSGGQTSFSINNNIDARGSSMTEGQFRSILNENNRNLMQTIERRAPANMANNRLLYA